MPDPVLIAVATVVMLLAGSVKGFIGLGMPTVALALLTLYVDARSAVALILIPMFASNIWQFWRGPDMVRCVRQHWRYALLLMVFVSGTVVLSQDAPDRFLRVVLGVLILAFCFFSWRDLVPPIPANRVRVFECASAIIAGLVGGLTAAWAPPLAIYLNGLRLERDAFVQALGFLIMMGSIALLVTYPAVGHVTLQDVGLSSYLLVPTLIGFTVGERLRHRSDPESFKKIFLAGFAILGMNLLVGTLFSGFGAA